VREAETTLFFFFRPPKVFFQQRGRTQSTEKANRRKATANRGEEHVSETTRKNPITARQWIRSGRPTVMIQHSAARRKGFSVHTSGNWKSANKQTAEPEAEFGENDHQVLSTQNPSCRNFKHRTQTRLLAMDASRSEQGR